MVERSVRNKEDKSGHFPTWRGKEVPWAQMQKWWIEMPAGVGWDHSARALLVNSAE